MDYETKERLMTDLEDRWEKFNDEFLKFERVEKKRSPRSDLHAFLLLDELCPADRDMVGGAEHDVIYLSVDVGDVVERLNDDLVIELNRCGVMFDSDNESFSMFV